MRNRSYENIQTTKDMASGKVVTEKSNFTRLIDPEAPFMKLYFEESSMLSQCFTKQGLLLIELLSVADYKNQIKLLHETKEHFCRRLKIFKKGTEEVSVNSFNVVLSRIVKTGILRRKSSGIYIVNPVLFAKGRWADILELRLAFEHKREPEFPKRKDRK